MQYLSPFPGFSKTKILARREEELRHALQQQAAPRTAAKAAERVRIAQLHLIKAFRHALMPAASTQPSNTEKLDKLQAEADLWEHLSTDEIIERYQDDRP